MTRNVFGNAALLSACNTADAEKWSYMRVAFNLSLRMDPSA